MNPVFLSLRHYILVVLRKIFILRMLSMFMGEVPDFLINARSVLDLVSVEKFDVSVNPLPFPISTSAGTEIPVRRCRLNTSG